MILIGIGSNLPSRRHGTSLATCEAALAAIGDHGVKVVRRSRWYRCSPLPVSNQPWFVNGVAEVETELTPVGLMEVLLGIEGEFGRSRSQRNAARILDLDILAYGGRVLGAAKVDGPPAALTVPHPRMEERAFVLLPLAELNSCWVHPISGLGIGELIAALPPGQTAEPMEE